MAQNKLIFGVLSTLRHQDGLPFAGQSKPFAELLTVARRRNVTAFVFTREDVDWQKCRVMGWDYNHNNAAGWRQRIFPLPTVVYNRIPNRVLESQPAMQEFLALLKAKYGPRFFNPGFLDKWETYRTLAGAKKTCCRLPETRPVTDPETIRQMLARYGDIYLKPRANSLGIGISRITKTPDGKLTCRTRQQGKSDSAAQYQTLEELLAALPPWQQEAPYLAQQTVKMARYLNRPFDIRLLAQKDRHGRWRKTGWAARVAAPGGITTHVIYGGDRLPVSQSLNKRRYTRLLAKANALAATVPAILEAAWQSSFGELEMDIAVDHSGELWLFEVNAKPFKFDENLLRAKSLLRLIHYARYLADSRPVIKGKRR
ncbi:MAG: YheC/YheD family protein [Bacillota bacterium]